MSAQPANISEPLDHAPERLTSLHWALAPAAGYGQPYPKSPVRSGDRAAAPRNSSVHDHN